MLIKVGVVGENASGEPDVLYFEVKCEQREYDEGEHYEVAKRQSEDAGFTPRIAFDQKDPLWSAMNPKADKFFERFAATLSSCWAPGEEVGGADTIDAVAQLFWTELEARDAKAWVVFGPGMNYVAQEVNADGSILGVVSDEAAFVLDRDLVDEMKAAGSITVEVSAKALRAMGAPLPSVDEMQSAFEAIAETAKEEDFTEELTRPEALMDAYEEEEAADLPKWFAPILSAHWSTWVPTQALSEVIVARSWGHCFVGSKESMTRWAYSRQKEALVRAQLDIGAGRWRDLAPAEVADLLEGLRTNKLLSIGDGKLVDEWGLEVMSQEDFEAEEGSLADSQFPRERN